MPTSDGGASVGDIPVVLAEWGSTMPPADIDGSGEVDLGDLLIVLDQWGPC